jgi:hypothetical protein
MKSYVDLGHWLESKGIGYYFQGSDQMIISDKNPAMPNSSCFWVTLRGDVWYIGTWLPAAYHIPGDQDICEICESIFRSSNTALWTFGNDLVARFDLRRLTDAEIEQLEFV